MPKLLFLTLLITLLQGCKESGVIFSATPERLGDRSDGLVYLTPLIGDSIRDNERSYKIKVPAAFANKDVAYGSIYFGGGQKFVTEREVYILIHSYEQKHPVVVFDINGNTDFTDDSIFSIEHDMPFDVAFTTGEHPEEKAVNRFWLIDSARLRSPLIFSMDSARKKQEPLSSYCFSESRMDFKKILLPDSNVVTIWDWNFNGRYNDKEDKVVAGDLTKDTFSLIRNNPMFTKYARSNDELIFNNNTYRLVEVDKYGKEIELKPLNKVVSQVETLADFSYSDEKGQKHKFIPGTTQYSVLYFWGAWCVGCRQQSPLYLSLKDSIPGVAYYAFNHGDGTERMLKYLEKTKLPLKPYEIDNKTAEHLSIVGYPTFIVVDNKQRVMLRTTQIGMVYWYLKKNVRK